MSVIKLLILIIMFSAIAASGDKETKIEQNTLLVLNLEGPIVDRVTEDPFQEVMSGLTGQPAPEGLNRLLKNIEKAKRDKNISGIILESGMVSAGYATIEEVRDALVDFKTSGKYFFII